LERTPLSGVQTLNGLLSESINYLQVKAHICFGNNGHQLNSDSSPKLAPAKLAKGFKNHTPLYVIILLIVREHKFASI